MIAITFPNMKATTHSSRDAIQFTNMKALPHIPAGINMLKRVSSI